MEKLEKTLQSITEKVNEFKKSEQKPVYYWNWIKRKIKVESEIIRLKYHG